MSTEETWQQRRDREEREYKVKMQKAWEKYRLRKDGSRSKCTRYNADGTPENCGYDIIFDEGTKITDTEVKSKTTTFRFDSDRKLYAYFQNTKKQQRFLVVNGPRAGERIVDDSEDYVLYNCAGFNRGAYKNDSPPRCVLVHRSGFEVKT